MLAFSIDYYEMIFRVTQSVELFCAYEIEACKSFFNKNKQNEKKLFCDEMLCTLKKIVYEEFGLEVDYH